jgi:hypothetical protein
LSDDAARQAILERLGWQFVRIRGSSYYRDPDAAFKRVLDRLGELGIEPSNATDKQEPEAAAESVLVQELLAARRAPASIPLLAADSDKPVRRPRRKPRGPQSPCG